MKFGEATFSNQDLTLDFNDFARCKFVKCTLVYHGFGPVGLARCEFVDVKWNFSGPAGNTVKFMTALYQGAGEGGKRLIEGTFENIKQGKAPDPGTVH